MRARYRNGVVFVAVTPVLLCLPWGQVTVAPPALAALIPSGRTSIAIMVTVAFVIAVVHVAHPVIAIMMISRSPTIIAIMIIMTCVFIAEMLIGVMVIAIVAAVVITVACHCRTGK
ncbi:MAG TPA: hypothetical protein VFA89_09760 [Terriglobales bacterium]|nr:hypothetical protein [Terriglobales bacterium]